MHLMRDKVYYIRQLIALGLLFIELTSYAKSSKLKFYLLNIMQYGLIY